MPTTLTMELRTVGEIVRTLRVRRGLEQVELAEACGWRDASAVSRIETDRVRPTRRTLYRLSLALADETVTGSTDTVLALLYLAAGHPPTPAEVEAANLPPIDSWPHPAALIDFSWQVWRVNDPFRRLIGLAIQPKGRHLLELFADPATGIRDHLGDRWERALASSADCFRSDIAGRETERWFRLLARRLARFPDLEQYLRPGGIVPGGGATPPRPMRYRWHLQGSGGEGLGVIILPLAGDPRIRTVSVVPENHAGLRQLVDLTTLEVYAGPVPPEDGLRAQSAPVAGLRAKTGPPAPSPA